MVRRYVIVICLAVFFVINSQVIVWGMDTDATTQELVQEIYNAGQYEKVDEIIEENWSKKISFTDLIYEIIYGEDNIASYVCEYVYDVFLYEIGSIKNTIVSMLSLIIIFIVFNKITVQRDSYISEVSFFMIYTALMTMLLSAFSVITDVVVSGITTTLNFLSAIIPAYSTTLVLSGKISTASAFYTFTVALLYILEWGIKVIILPAVQIYVVIELINNIYGDKQFSKLSGLVYRGIKFVLKTAIVVVGGIGCIQAVINSVKDQISESVLLRSVSLIPGVGKVAGASGEILISCAMLVKNSVGIAILCVLLAITLIPIVKVFIFQITYKFMAAILQPVSDNRIVDGIHSIACAGELYVNVLVDTMLLFFISIATVCVTGNMAN